VKRCESCSCHATSQKNEDEKYWAPHIPKGAIKYPTEILKKYFFEDFVAEANEERSIIQEYNVMI